MSYPTVRIIDNGPQLPTAGRPWLTLEPPVSHVMLKIAGRFWHAFGYSQPSPFDWRSECPDDFERHFPPLVFGGRGVVLTDDVLEDVRTRIHRRLSAGDVDSGLWAKT